MIDSGYGHQHSIGKLVDKNAIPDLITFAAQWVVFMGSREKTKSSTKSFRINKQPRRVTNPKKAASINKPDHCGNFDQAFESLLKHSEFLEQESEKNGCPGFFGLGVVLSDQLGITAYDIDNVIDTGTGEIHPYALELIQEIDSYTEWSPSGTGLRILVSGIIPSNVKRTLPNGIGFEMYCNKRYVTITGNVYSDG